MSLIIICFHADASQASSLRMGAHQLMCLDVLDDRVRQKVLDGLTSSHEESHFRAERSSSIEIQGTLVPCELTLCPC